MVIPARYQTIACQDPVVCTNHWAMSGENAPPSTAPRAYEIDTPENRTEAGYSSA